MCDCWWMLFWHKTICKTKKFKKVNLNTYNAVSPFLLQPPGSLSYLWRSCVKASTDRPVAILTGEMSVLEHFAASMGEDDKSVDTWYMTRGYCCVCEAEAQNMNPFFDCWDCIEVANKATCTWSFYVLWKRPNNLMLLACECSVGDQWYFNLKWYIPSWTFHGTEEEFGIWTWESRRNQNVPVRDIIMSSIYCQKTSQASLSYSVQYFSEPQDWDITLLQQLA